MKITLVGDDSIRLEQTGGPMTIEAASADQVYSPFHMLASSLAFCTHSILTSWATHAKLSADDLVVDVNWTFAEQPHRIGSLAVEIVWPSLPEKRVEAAKRTAALCAVHATLSHTPSISTSVER